MGVPPLPGLFGAPGRGGLLGERGEHGPGTVPAQVAQHLEGFVGEVDRVAPVDEDVVGDGGSHECGHGLRCRPGSSRGRKGSFRRVTIAGTR